MKSVGISRPQTTVLTPIPTIRDKLGIELVHNRMFTFVTAEKHMFWSKTGGNQNEV